MNKSIENQNRQRAAVVKALDRHKVHVSRKSYHNGRMWARVVYDGQAYDVNEHVYGMIMAGHTPSELELEPLPLDFEQ